MLCSGDTQRTFSSCAFPTTCQGWKAREHVLVCSAENLLHLRVEDGQTEALVSTFLSILAMNHTLSQRCIMNKRDDSKGDREEVKRKIDRGTKPDPIRDLLKPKTKTASTARWAAMCWCTWRGGGVLWGKCSHWQSVEGVANPLGYIKVGLSVWGGIKSRLTLCSHNKT